MALLDKRIYAATTTLHTLASTAAVVNNAMSVESAAFGTTEHTDHPMGEFELTITYSVAPTASTSIDLMMRETDILGTTASPAPSATYLRKRVGSFYPNASTSAQSLKVEAPLVKDATYYLFNNATGQTMPATAWGLKARAYGFGA